MIIQDIYPAGESSSGGDVLRGSCLARELSGGGDVLRGSCPAGESSSGGDVLRGSRPPGESSSGESSCGGVVRWESSRGSCPPGEWSYNQYNDPKTTVETVMAQCGLAMAL